MSRNGDTRLKVVLIYRRNVPGAFSVEEIYHSIAAELRREVEVVEFEVRGRALTVLDAVELLAMKADIYHITGDVTFLALLLPRRKTVITVHDIGHFLYGLTGAKRWIYKWLWLVLPLRWSARATSCSHQTRENIERHLSIPIEKIDLIEHPYRPSFRPVAKPFDFDRPVVLQVGTSSHKNVPRLITALAGLPVRLALVGGIDAELQLALDRSGIRYEAHFGVSNEKLAELYGCCDVVSFVSTSEGFGMPIIEGQIVGRPVITSNIPPMSDVAGNGACLVDPLDSDAIRAGIRRILADAGYRRDLVVAGRENVVRFSPARICAEYLELYRGMVRS